MRTSFPFTGLIGLRLEMIAKLKYSFEYLFEYLLK